MASGTRKVAIELFINEDGPVAKGPFPVNQVNELTIEYGDSENKNELS